jgi:hypothetical protein
MNIKTRKSLNKFTLLGILTKINDLGLSLISVTKISQVEKKE